MPYFNLSPLYGVNEMETSSIRMKDGRGMLWPDSFTENAQRLDMLPDSVPALLVLWNRYHNVCSQS
jgi:linoleate 10R-lipoxygenase